MKASLCALLLFGFMFYYGGVHGLKCFKCKGGPKSDCTKGIGEEVDCDDEYGQCYVTFEKIQDEISLERGCFEPVDDDDYVRYCRKFETVDVGCRSCIQDLCNGDPIHFKDDTE